MESLDAFTCEVKALIDQWKKEWEENNRQKPEEFPLEMEPGDWYEQLLIFFVTDD